MKRDCLAEMTYTYYWLPIGSPRGHGAHDYSPARFRPQLLSRCLLRCDIRFAAERAILRAAAADTGRSARHAYGCTRHGIKRRVDGIRSAATLLLFLGYYFIGKVSGRSDIFHFSAAIRASTRRRYRLMLTPAALRTRRMPRFRIAPRAFSAVYLRQFPP